MWQNNAAATLHPILGKQLVEALHVPKVARREAPRVGNLFPEIPAQCLEEPGAPPALGMQVGKILPQPQVEYQHLAVDRDRSLDLATTIPLAQLLNPGQVLRVVFDNRARHDARLPERFPSQECRTGTGQKLSPA